jgi:signal transduction histidine kinase
MCTVTVTKNDSEKELYFRVRAYPILMDNRKLILLFLQDVTSQQQWAFVEKIFFHDIKNILQVLISTCEILSDQQPFNSLVQTISKLSMQLSNEVMIQQALIKTGIPKYTPLLQNITARQIIYDVQDTISSHPAFKDKHLDIPGTIPDLTISSDLSLVCRVLVNMLINAFEASQPGDTVKITVETETKSLSFDVWNKQPIPQAIAKRIFQRNFSTKDEFGRGFGTYSMKLLGEKILGGNVTFTSSEADGTTFRFMLPL